MTKLEKPGQNKMQHNCE